jgi:hypothetical protein
MNDLLVTVEKVLSSGEITPEQEEHIGHLLWKTPLNQSTFKALSRLEESLSCGKVSLVHHA